MKVAIISFDVKYVESLKQQLPNIELIPYGDTISFLKESEVHKPDIVIYDTTSGIFAEDDLRYILSKSIVKDKKIFGLVSTDNHINLSLLEDRVLFFNKTEDLQKMVSTILSLAPASQQQEPEIEISKPEKLEIGELSHQDYIDSSFLEFENLNEVSESVSIKQPSLEVESFDIQTHQDIFKDQEFQVQPDFHIDTDVLEHPHVSYTEPLEIEEIPLETDILQSAAETTLESEALQQTPATTEIIQHEEHFYPLETESAYKEKEDRGLEYIKDTTTESPSENKLTLGGEGMVANFNIQISEGELKKMALQVAREFLEKDPAMEKIVNHLQIDFQEETRRELDNIKSELREQLKKEAELMMMQEIQRLIKEELKDYVADITARIVKEKLEQVFRSS